MILARLGIFAAILTSIYINGSYAYTKGEGISNQWTMIIVAVTIDIAKVSFLSASVHLRAYGFLFRPLLLVLLFVPCFAFSTFCSYAYFSKNRSVSSAEDQTRAQARTRAQRTYDQASSDLAVAKQHRYWKRSGGCTSPQTRRERSFCSKLTPTQQRLAAAESLLNQRAVVYVDPEMQTLATTFDMDMTTLELIAAIVPALILELLAGLGLYALNVGPNLKASERLSKHVFSNWREHHHKTSESSSEPLSVPPEHTSQRNVNSGVEPVVESIDWSNAKPV